MMNFFRRLSWWYVCLILAIALGVMTGVFFAKLIIMAMALEPVAEAPKPTVTIAEQAITDTTTVADEYRELQAMKHLQRIYARQAEQERKVPKSNEIASRGGSRVVKVLEDCEITWYNNDGISYETRSGTRTVDGVTASVDPKVIPLGSWIEIYMPDGTVLKRRAEDTGGAVKGNIVDVYADTSHKELMRRGRTYGVKVVVLGGE